MALHNIKPLTSASKRCLFRSLQGERSTATIYHHCLSRLSYIDLGPATLRSLRTDRNGPAVGKRACIKKWRCSSSIQVSLYIVRGGGCNSFPKYERGETWVQDASGTALHCTERFLIGSIEIHDLGSYMKRQLVLVVSIGI